MKQLTIKAQQVTENGLTVNAGGNTYTVEGRDALARSWRIAVTGAQTVTDAINVCMMYFCGLFTVTATARA